MPAQHRVIGSRQSPLALVQSHSVMAAIQAYLPDISVELKTYSTQGDRILDRPLSDVGDKGLFVKELETALLKGEIDFAVHSMKDMTAHQPDGLYLQPFGRREDARDAFVSNRYATYRDLPPGAVIGTASLRRQALLNRLRPDVMCRLIRGNVQTRLKKLDAGDYDALVLAAAGLNRLNLQDRIAQYFTIEEMLPACCQGILAVEYRDPELTGLFEAFTPASTKVAALAERAFLEALEAGCQTPVAAYAYESIAGQYEMNAFLMDASGNHTYTGKTRFSARDACLAGATLGRELLAKSS